MNRELVHTPEGVRDIYGKECADRQVVQNQVHEAMKRFGYEDINTPTFEFFDVFAEEISATSARELYKFFDKEGNTLVLRPDFTPSVARCVSKYFLEDDQPVRICYSGNTFMNTTRLQGKLREYMQMGAELMNDDSVQADAEMISMMIQALSGSGLAEFQVSVGDADYYKGICEEAGIDEETEAELREQIAGKNYFAAEKILVDRNVPEKYRDMLLKVSEYVGSVDELEKAVSQVENSRSRQAVARLQELYRVLTMYGVEKYISFDLSMLSQYNYYTGVIFKAYTYGVGDAIACRLRGARCHPSPDGQRTVALGRRSRLVAHPGHAAPRWQAGAGIGRLFARGAPVCPRRCRTGRGHAVPQSERWGDAGGDWRQ